MAVIVEPVELNEVQRRTYTSDETEIHPVEIQTL